MFLRKHHTHLKRELTLLDLIVYGLSITIGAGIYALIGKAAGISGNAVWLSFILAAVIAAITGLSYAELSSMFPRDAAEYTYTKKAFSSKKFSFALSWLIIFVGAVSSAAVSLGFGGYLEALFGIPTLYGAMGLIIFLSLLGIYGLKESMEAIYAMTLATVGGLVAIVAYSRKFIGTVDYFEMPHGLPGVLEASAFVFFAYLGFEALANMSEEAKNPKRNVPIAMIASIAIAAALYVAVAVSSVSVVPWDILSQSKAPVADVAARIMPGAFVFISVIALFATSSTVLTFLISSSRRIYGMTEEHSLPGIFAYLHPERGTPVIAIISFAFVSLLFTLVGDISFVARLTNFGSFLIFSVVQACLIYLRYKEPSAERKYKVPLSIGKFPVLAGFGLVLSLSMMLQFEASVVLISAAVFLSGSVVYMWLDTISRMIVISSNAMRRIYSLFGRHKRNGNRYRFTG